MLACSGTARIALYTGSQPSFVAISPRSQLGNQFQQWGDAFDRVILYDPITLVNEEQRERK